MILLILVPYHAAMAYNVWGEPNYITLEGSRTLSSFIVFFSPFFMPLLFALAGVSAHHSLEKRTVGKFIKERVKRLLIPFAFGTIVLMPIMTYIADRFNCGYDGGFFRHYVVFFTKFTDLTGADGGFSLGQFWFLLYLFAVSLAGVGLVALIEKLRRNERQPMPFPVVIGMGLMLALVGGALSIGGKSLIEYLFFFMVGYYALSDDESVEELEKHCWPLLAIGLAASALDIYLFIWSGKELPLLNDAAKYVAEWFMVLALVGLAKRYLDFGGKASEYMSARSFLFYTWHFIWVVLFQYIFYPVCGTSVAVYYAFTAVLSYIMTFASCEVCARVPLLCFLTGTKYVKKSEQV